MEPFEDDPAWYPASWTARPDTSATTPSGAPTDVPTGGLELELVGGPLAGRTALVRDSEFSLWVARHRRRWIVRAARLEPTALPPDAMVTGAYVFDHGLEAMAWSERRSPAPDRAVA